MVATTTSVAVSAIAEVADTVSAVTDIASTTTIAVSDAITEVAEKTSDTVSAIADSAVHDQVYLHQPSWSSYQHTIYSNFRPPLFTTDPSKWENLAKAKIPHGNFWYAAGSAGLFRTCASNLDAFNRYRLRLRMFVDATVRDCSIELFWKRYSSPLLVGPIGVQEIFHKDAEEATARAAAKVGVPMVLSMAATRTIEQVAKANGTGDRWFQVSLPFRLLVYFDPDGTLVSYTGLKWAKMISLSVS
jgi:hypothetical protein